MDNRAFFVRDIRGRGILSASPWGSVALGSHLDIKEVWQLATLQWGSCLWRAGWRYCDGKAVKIRYASDTLLTLAAGSTPSHGLTHPRSSEQHQRGLPFCHSCHPRDCHIHPVGGERVPDKQTKSSKTDAKWERVFFFLFFFFHFLMSSLSFGSM